MVLRHEDKILLIDGMLRYLVLKELNTTEVSVLFSTVMVTDEMSLEDIVMEYQIRKELSLSEKVKEIKQILLIGKPKDNKYYNMDKRRESVSLRLGKGFKRSSIIDLEKVMLFENDYDFDLKLSEKIISGQLPLQKSINLLDLIRENEYTSAMESESYIIKNFLEGKYDLNQTEKLIKKKVGKDDDDKPYRPNFPQSTSRYQLIQGSVYDVDLSDVTFDVIFSSPPYHLQRVYGNNDVQEVGIDKDVDSYIKSLVDAFEIGYKRLSDTGSMFININDTYRDGFSLNIIEKFVCEMERRGMRKVQTICWEKKNPKPMGNDVHRLTNKFEYIIHVSKTKNYV